MTVPAGAVASTATFKVTIFAPGTGPHKTQSQARKAQTLHPVTKTQTLAAGDAELIDIVIDDGGVPLLLPMQITDTTATAPATGTTPYLEGFNNGTYDDVATMPYSGGKYAQPASDPTFPGATLASNTEYVLYTHTGTQAGDGTVSVTGPSAVPSGTQGTFTASEATLNGFPYLGRTFNFTLDNPSAGSISPASGTSTVFTAGAAGGTANITATDSAVATRSGSAKVSATSSRPSLAGTTGQYTGTLTETIANNQISTPAPGTPVTSVSSYNVRTTVVASTDGSGNAVFTAAETDTSPLRTLTTNTASTVSYTTTNGVTNVRALKTVATDSNGVSYETDYGSNNGLQTIIPETNGSFSNDAGSEYKEIDPGFPIAKDGNGNATGATIDRRVNADGTYTQYNGAFSTSLGTPTTNTSKEYPNFSGEMDLPSIVPGGRVFTFLPPSGATITYKYYNNFSGSTTTFQSPNWIPGTLATPSVETDTITTGQALDASCAPAQPFATTATKVTQQITIADAVQGSLETRTTTSYDVPGPGTVCTVVSDNIGIFYDFTEQEGFNPRITPARNATTPVESITIAETLSLQSSNAPGTSSASRSVKSIGQGLLIPHSLLLSKVQHLVHQEAQRRLSALRSTGGSAK